MMETEDSGQVNAAHQERQALKTGANAPENNMQIQKKTPQPENKPWWKFWGTNKSASQPSNIVNFPSPNPEHAARINQPYDSNTASTNMEPIPTEAMANELKGNMGQIEQSPTREVPSQEKPAG